MTATMPAKQEFAEKTKAQCLPEGNDGTVKKVWYQAVP
jgi:hypothetical protein